MTPGTARDTDDRVADQLLLLTRRLHRAQKGHLRALGVTPAQARLLRALGGYETPPRMADLAARMEVVPRAVTTLVDALEANDCVRRAPDPANRRAIRIELTENGRNVLADLHIARRDAAKEFLAPLAPERRAVLGELLTELVGADDQRRC